MCSKFYIIDNVIETYLGVGKMSIHLFDRFPPDLTIQTDTICKEFLKKIQLCDGITHVFIYVFIYVCARAFIYENVDKHSISIKYRLVELYNPNETNS